jgi:hypothetical protein
MYIIPKSKIANPHSAFPLFFKSYPQVDDRVKTEKTALGFAGFFIKNIDF